MPRNGSIIRRGRPEVNFAIACFLLVVVLAGCSSDEDRAQRMYDAAMDDVRDEDLEGAIAKFGEVVQRYPETPAGREAAKDIVLYRGLAGAVDRFPARSARDLMVDTARRIERFRGRNRRAPRSLEELFGAEQVPTDPWGRPLRYRTIRGGRGYELSCLGMDDKAGGTGNSGDLLVRNGEFVLE